MKIETYNQKGFLLPASIRSCASYHAKIKPDGEYQFRIHDCNTGIRLRGNLTDPKEVQESIDKLMALEEAARNFRIFIQNNYLNEE